MRSSPGESAMHEDVHQAERERVSRSVIETQSGVATTC